MCQLEAQVCYSFFVSQTMERGEKLNDLQDKTTDLHNEVDKQPRKDFFFVKMSKIFKRR